MPKTAYGSSTLVIAQVTMPPTYTHLQFMRIGTGNKHIHVIIGLDNDSISLGRVQDSFFCHPAYIGHNHELMFSCLNIVSHSLSRIVRNDEILDTETGNIIPFTLDKFFPALTQKRRAECMGRQCGMQFRSRINRFPEFLAIRSKTTYMIHVVMGHEHGTETVFIQPVGRQNGLQPSQTDAGVYKNRMPLPGTFLRFEIIAVASSTA